MLKSSAWKTKTKLDSRHILGKKKKRDVLTIPIEKEGTKP